MSSTRRAAPGSDPEQSPERLLASAKLRGLSIGLNIVARVARVRPEHERAAMFWLCAYARLRDLTADALSGELHLDKEEIRRALTDPNADLARFTERVGKLRARFDAAIDTPRAPDARSPFGLLSKFDDALRPIADTKVARKIRNACRLALSSPQIVEVVGKSRIGKSIAARREYLRQMHRAAWLHCPRPGVERDFLSSLAEALGVSTGSAYKNAELIPKIECCFGPQRINLLFVDEGHRLWPVGAHTEPKRIEFLRDLWERLDVSVVILATPQYSAALADSMKENPRYAPAQWVGRVQPFHLPDQISAEDLDAIARHHAPDATREIIGQLVAQAQASEGYAGAMVAAIQRARFRDDDGRLTLEAVKDAQRQLDHEARAALLHNRVVKLTAKRPRADTRPIRPFAPPTAEAS